MLPILLTAQQSCLEPENLKALDLRYEQALKNNDVAFFESHLADEYLWVHNHASATDTKEAILDRAKDPTKGATGNPIARESEDVKVIRYGNTAVVTGFTTVKRETSAPRYNFMRTYVEVDDQCLLLASHTMRIPDE